MCAHSCGIINASSRLWPGTATLTKGQQELVPGVGVRDTRALSAMLHNTPCSCQSKKKIILKKVL